MGIKLFIEATKALKSLVAERSVTLSRFFVKEIGKIRSENAGMSNVKFCEKQNRLNFKVFCGK